LSKIDTLRSAIRGSLSYLMPSDRDIQLAMAICTDNDLS